MLSGLKRVSLLRNPPTPDLSQTMRYAALRWKKGFKRWTACGFLCICVLLVVTVAAAASTTPEERRKEKPKAGPATRATSLSNLTLTANSTVSRSDGNRVEDSQTTGKTDSPEIIWNRTLELDPDEVPNPAAVASEVLFLRQASTGSRRVVLSYSLKGCPSQKLEEGRATEHPTSLHGQEASSRTMHLLRDRISWLLHSKNLVKEVESVSTKRDEILGYGQDYHVSLRVTVEMESRYLSALQMEIIKTLPEGVSDDEVIQIAQDLPCVENAYHDSLKFSEQYLRHPVSAGDTDGMNIETKRLLQQLSRGQSSSHPLESLGARVTNAFETGDILSNADGDVQVPPNDPSFRLQWNLHDKAEFGLHAEKAWQLWTGQKRPMVIAVIDSGCDLDHPDLRAKKWHNPGEICNDGIDNDGNGFVDDCHGWDFASDRPDVHSDSTGHGTGAAGVLGAVPNNLIGLVGVCWGCEIMCLKFIGGGQGTVSNQVQAIDYAVRMGAWISNNSYGGYGYSNLEFDAIRRAQAAGHLFVTSAGNHNLNTDLPQNDHTPSSYDLSNILSVGASTHIGRKAAFSNYGLTTVHVFAPGADIHTTEGVAGYSKVSGTSFACPHAAGLAGLIWSAFPSLTYLQVKRALIEGCRTSLHLRSLATCGGTLDAHNSLYIAAKLSSGSTTEAKASHHRDYGRSDLDAAAPAALVSRIVRGASPAFSATPAFLSVPATSRDSSASYAPTASQSPNELSMTTDSAGRDVQTHANPLFVAPNYRRPFLVGPRSSEMATFSIQPSGDKDGASIFYGETGPSLTRLTVEGEEELPSLQPSATSGTVNFQHGKLATLKVREEKMTLLDEDPWHDEIPRSFALFSGTLLPEERRTNSSSSLSGNQVTFWSVGSYGKEHNLSAESESSRADEVDLSASNVKLTVKNPESVYKGTTTTLPRENVKTVGSWGPNPPSRQTARTNNSLQALLKDTFSLPLGLGRELLTVGNLVVRVPAGNNSAGKEPREKAREGET